MMYSSRFSWFIYIGFPISIIGLTFMAIQLYMTNPYFSILPALGVVATITDIFRHLTQLREHSDRVELKNLLTGKLLTIPFNGTSNYRIEKHRNFRVTLTFATEEGFKSISLTSKYYTNFNNWIKLLNEKIGK